nr:glutaredoxin 3 [Stenotrophomonas sp. CFBP 13724]
MRPWRGFSIRPLPYTDSRTVVEFPVSQLEQPAGGAPAITIYSTAVCPYCVAAKNFLKSKGQQWTEVRIDLDAAEREKMMAKTRRTSVPQIFVGDVHVGGYDDMMALHREGKLEPLLAGQGAA